MPLLMLKEDIEHERKDREEKKALIKMELQ